MVVAGACSVDSSAPATLCFLFPTYTAEVADVAWVPGKGVILKSGARENEGPLHGGQEAGWSQLSSPIGPPGIVGAINHHTGSVPNACLCGSLSLRGRGVGRLPEKAVGLDRMFQKALAA